MNSKFSVTENDVSKEKLMQDLQLVVSDAEELLRMTASQAGEKVSAARERIQDRVMAAKEHLAIAEEAMLEKTRQAARATDEYVHENPWRAVGIGAAAGLVIGMLISRGR
ncbi:MAG: DUF883 family protein [Gallionella sp.]|jgi:ElaB/YqjD/DUF883 family membrane-anchored ribosome-binding protein